MRSDHPFSEEVSYRSLASSGEDGTGKSIAVYLSSNSASVVVFKDKQEDLVRDTIRSRTTMIGAAFSGIN